jgi:hypothetical protein
MLGVAEAAASVVAAADFTEAGSVAVAACTRDVSTEVATVVGCVRHIHRRPPGSSRYPIAGRPGRRATRSRAGAIADRRGGVGAAAVGAAAYGAYGAYNNCYDAYGNWICSNQYQY